jgi:hypothetical protein
MSDVVVLVENDLKDQVKQEIMKLSINQKSVRERKQFIKLTSLKSLLLYYQMLTLIKNYFLVIKSS